MHQALRTCLFSLTLVLPSWSVFAQAPAERVIVVSPAVGEAIDGAEKARFGLFPDYAADDFQEARFLRALAPDSAITLRTRLRDGRLQQDTYARKIYSHVLAGKMRSAIQITTASSLCAMLDLLAAGELPRHGFVRQEDVPLAAFLANRFGRVYAADALAHAA